MSGLPNIAPLSEKDYPQTAMLIADLKSRIEKDYGVELPSIYVISTNGFGGLTDLITSTNHTLNEIMGDLIPSMREALLKQEVIAGDLIRVVTLNASAGSLGGTHAIIVTESLLNFLSPEEFTAVSGHEWGHFICGHTQKREFSVSKLGQDELDADAFSVHYGQAKHLASALDKIQNLIDQFPVLSWTRDLISTHPPTTTRIEKLEEAAQSQLGTIEAPTCKKPKVKLELE
jgi:hypothetical protein